MKEKTEKEKKEKKKKKMKVKEENVFVTPWRRRKIIKFKLKF